ncbi:MAG: hypothetical protein IJK52_10755, partial [Oscillospiraceae bacterium]|nr:hypothetical protein [Oscillospiraceae bacterium]
MMGLRFAAFLLRYALAGTALGFILQRAGTFKGLAKTQRFLLGLTLTPACLSLSTALLALIWVGIPREALFAAPVALSALSLFPLLRTARLPAWSSRRLGESLKNAGKTFLIRLKECRDRDAMFFQALTLCLLLLFTVRLAPIFHTAMCREWFFSDESHYLTQAKIFWIDRNTREIDQYAGKWEGTVYADDHGPLWPVCMADTMLLEETFDVEAKELAALRLLTTAGMLLALWNTGWILSGSLWGGLCAFACYMLYRESILFPIWSGSRDGFRMMALLAFFILTERLWFKLREERSVSAEDMGWLFLLSYLCINGHQGNVFIMLTASLALLARAIAFRIPPAQILLSGLSVLTGTLLCLIKNFRYYLKTGRMVTSTLWAFRGTEVERVRLERISDDSLSALLDTFGETDRLLALLGFAAMLYYLVKIVLLLRGKYRGDRSKPDRAGVILVFLLPITGIFNFLGYNVS